LKFSAANLRHSCRLDRFARFYLPDARHHAAAQNRNPTAGVAILRRCSDVFCFAMRQHRVSCRAARPRCRVMLAAAQQIDRDSFFQVWPAQRM